MINEQYSFKKIEIGKEKNTVLILDDFLSHPNDILEYAVTAEFSPYPAALQKKGYPGVRADAPQEYGHALSERISPLVKECFNIDSSAKLKIYQEALCLMTVKEDQLGPLQTVPHFDATDPNFFAVLLYLCDEKHGGTAFYRHNKSGFESITQERCDLYLDLSYEELNQKRREKKYFSESDELYSKINFLPAKFNRLVIYKGSLLHSANILSNISINSDPASGRLTLNVFWTFES